MKLLIVEDEQALAASMAAYLQSDYAVTVVNTLAQAEAQATNADVVLLDLALPDGDGLVWLATWRAHLSAKVVVLTANDSEGAQLQGLALADEYLLKPLSLRLLKARLQRLWPKQALQFGAISVDLVGKSVTKAGMAVTLSATEWRLLAYLVANHDQVLSRAQLLAALWDGRDAGVEDNTLTVTIKRLREKLEVDPTKPTLIRTIRGMGYWFDAKA